MKILVVGSGGREHALVWKAQQSPLVDKIYCAPGNGGTAEIAENVDINADDIPGLLQFAQKKHIDLTIVGPEVPLTLGIVNAFDEVGLKIFGPTKEAAELEGSKVYAKEFMYENNIPTAPFITFTNIDEAKTFIQQAEFPLVVKADGLAAGKGVIICANAQEALEAVSRIMGEKIFQEAGNSIVIEECLSGEEVSLLVVSDGQDYVVLESSQDHKRIFDDALGPNTGGMGAYSPAPIMNRGVLKQVEAEIIRPVILGMKKAGRPFHGVLYLGLMITEEGPSVLEFNVRFGDPETQAVLPRLKSDLVDLMLACCEERLKDFVLDWDVRACVCVVMSSGGYPGAYDKGKVISGLDAVQNEKDMVVFHAGTKKEKEHIVTSGGRVLGVTSLGANIEAAITTTYENVEKISFDRCFFRRDIGAKAMKAQTL